MSRFNLKDLPRCGAKTRSGEPCKRFGNKRNGRCKLHGGRSTGAKTPEGKLAVKVNPVANAFAWYIKQHILEPIDNRVLYSAIYAYMGLIELIAVKNNGKQINKIISENRIELERLKYYIAGFDGPSALEVIQSALDHYYTDAASEHLNFHLYAPIATSPYFGKLISKAQIEAHREWDNKKMKKAPLTIGN